MNSDKSIVPGGLKPSYRNAIQNYRLGLHKQTLFHLELGLSNQVKKNRKAFSVIGEFVSFIQSDFAIRNLSDISKVLYEYQRSSKHYRAKDKFCNYIMEACRIVLNTESFNSVEQWGDLIQEKAFETIFHKECLFRQEAKELRERAKELRFESIPEDVHKKNLGWWKNLGPFRRVYKEFGIQSSDEDLTG